MNHQSMRAVPLMNVGEFEGNTLKGERPLIEAVGITAERLQDIEQRLYQLEGLLFGSNLNREDCCGVHDVPNVSSCALDALGRSARIQRLVDELIQRITG